MPAPRFEFTDAKWLESTQCSGLRPKARPAIEEAIGIFRVFQAADRRTTSAIRKKLKALHRCALDFHARLTEVLADPTAHAALRMPEDPTLAFPRDTRPEEKPQNVVLPLRTELKARLAQET